MDISLLCNAGLALTYEGKTLLVDVPSGLCPPFQRMEEPLWEKILHRESPFENVCGLYFTHDHPDHCDRERVADYRRLWPEVPVYFPEAEQQEGTVVMGPFVISYGQFPHAPLDEPVPPHVVTWIRAGEQSVYITADAVPDVDRHRAFLKGRKANFAFWTSMYLSRPETRQLLHETAENNFIYHMPADDPDSWGLWRKCRLNFERFGEELENITVLRI